MINIGKRENYNSEECHNRKENYLEKVTIREHLFKQKCITQELIYFIIKLSTNTIFERKLVTRKVDKRLKIKTMHPRSTIKFESKKSNENEY